MPVTVGPAGTLLLEWSVTGTSVTPVLPVALDGWPPSKVDGRRGPNPATPVRGRAPLHRHPGAA